MDLGEIRWGGMKWIDLSQGREQWRAHVNTAMNLRVGKFLSSGIRDGFSSRAQLHEQEYKYMYNMSEKLRPTKYAVPSFY
jgi:hypothetical protein